MTLRDLDAEFICRGANGGFQRVQTIAEAEGIWFVCPQCYVNKGNTVKGAHHILCWGPAVPQTVTPTGGRWQMQGKSIDDLTLVAGSSSVFLAESECKAHFFVRNGSIVNAA